jgi:fructose-bisphosphate aldolase class I
MLLKPNMVISGTDCPTRASAEEVAKATIRCFRAVVPAAVPGIVFLSGGQGDEEATANLNAMNALGSHPWELSFSYGRALQAPSLKAWRGEDANIRAGQEALSHRARMNGSARDGSYSAEQEKELAAV